MPNQISAGDRSEIEGTKRPNWMKGSRLRRASRTAPISSPRPAPIVQPSTNPAKIRRRLTTLSFRRRPETISPTRALPTMTGVGNSTGGKNVALTTCQRSTRAHTDSTGTSTAGMPRRPRAAVVFADASATFPAEATLIAALPPGALPR